ncbi:ABC transporter ATP-binding protein [Aquamicrobium sp. LC103]|uniref:ABC transporter ATP-binding protein n=1 Tax=Aquamicrobium sp. LC103 TaxID=1120658 RepID=UPI00063E86D1|nr:ABC transporter ATP-binding protein [Aquamicrobium sp. LC103]TKT69459.1 ABC transporter ATP-binding protein [Aquamicrobium sp. LC103]
MALLSIEGVSKSFGSHQALKDVSLNVEAGEFVSLLGPSGCGKTTLLRLIAGFLTADRGTIRIDGEDITNVPAHRRPLNTVFQNYALFPHMSVQDNVAYGPRRSGAGRVEAAERASEALSLVGLGQMGDRYPRQLSGGQQQRVALARAIVNRPKLLLLDEPLSALDLQLRRRMQVELKQLQEKLGVAFVFVTHDQEEAMAMSDRISVLSEGRIQQVGNGAEIYRRPANRFVAEFIGEANLLSIDSAHGFEIVFAPADQSTNRLGVVRPEHVRILREGDTAALSENDVRITAEVAAVASIGGTTDIHCTSLGYEIVARRLGLSDGGFKPGDKVTLVIAGDDIHIIESERS